MFTGIVQAMGQLVSADATPAGRRLVIDIGDWRAQPTPVAGDSVCVSGVCLTLLPPEPRESEHMMAFDVITETLNLTTLGDLAPGARVNLEPSLTGSTPLGGHFVQGHVEGVGRVVRVQDSPSDWRIEIEPPSDLLDCIAPKGSATVDGVSMTVAAVSATTFEVAVIPTTLSMTTLGQVKAGTRINVETDIIARSVVHYQRRVETAKAKSEPVTMDLLTRAGFAS